MSMIYGYNMYCAATQTHCGVRQGDHHRCGRGNLPSRRGKPNFFRKIKLFLLPCLFLKRERLRETALASLLLTHTDSFLVVLPKNQRRRVLSQLLVRSTTVKSSSSSSCSCSFEWWRCSELERRILKIAARYLSSQTRCDCLKCNCI